MAEFGNSLRRGGLLGSRVDILMSNAAGERATAADQELVRAARTGDRQAYGQLYLRYAPMVHGVLLARVAPGLVDDLLQDVFLKAMTQLRYLREDDHFGGWIASIARNRAADHYRRQREVQDVDEVAEAVTVPERASSDLDASGVLAVLRALPDTYRETLTLRLVEGMTGPEIAARTGLAHDSVRVNLHRGMKLLRQRLQPAQPGAAERGPRDE